MIEQIGNSCFRVWLGYKLIGAYGDLITAQKALDKAKELAA